MYSKSKANKCKYCGQFFFLKSGLVAHELKHKEEERETQSTEVDTGNEANAIEAESSEPKENEAESVSRELDTMNHDENLMKGSEPFSCHICGKQYNLKSLLETHLISHKLPEAQFSVDIGNSCDSIKQEIDSCFSCSFCQKEFTNWKACTQHIRQNHRASKLGHSGETKSRNITNADSDDEGMLISDGSKSKPVPIDESCDTGKREEKACFSCCFCEKDFANREACTQHIRQSHKLCEIENSGETKARSIKIAYSDDEDDNISEFSKSKPVAIDESYDSGNHEITACFSCSLCQKKYTTKKSCDQHIRRNHKPSKFGDTGKTKTRIIKKANSDYVTLEDFNSKPLDVPNYLCTICNEKCPSKIVLSEHIKIHEEDPTCVKCQKKYNNIKALRDHLKVHLDKKYVLCETCGKSVRTNHYSIHLRVHSGVKPFQCKNCDKCFTQKAHLRTHMKYHNKVREHCCEVCSKLFITKNDLIRHMKVHIGKDDGQFKCKTCNEKFTKWQSLNKHEREAHPGNSFVCHICNIEFMYSSFLYEHYLAQHSEEDIQMLDSKIKESVFKKKMLSVKCTCCDKYILKYQLNAHMKIHTGEKPFECNHCGKKFLLYNNLIIHERTHTGERPYHCNFCSKTFTQSSHLKNHIALHSGEKPYKCKFCDKAFAVSSYLYNHEKIHTKDGDGPVRVRKGYECARCGNKFKRKSDCTDHESSCQYVPGDTSSSDISDESDDNESMRTREYSESTIDHISIDCDPSDHFEV